MQYSFLLYDNLANPRYIQKGMTQMCEDIIELEDDCRNRNRTLDTMGIYFQILCLFPYRTARRVQLIIRSLIFVVSITASCDFFCILSLLPLPDKTMNPRILIRCVLGVFIFTEQSHEI